MLYVILLVKQVTEQLETISSSMVASFQRIITFQKVGWLLWICLIIARIEDARGTLTLKPNKLMLAEAGGDSRRVEVNCSRWELKPIRHYKFQLSFGPQLKLLASADSEVDDGNPIVSQTYADRGASAVKLSDGSGFILTLPVATCEDAGVYTCKYTFDGQQDLNNASLTIEDSLQAANLILSPDKAVKNVSEGETLVFTCRQIYGMIDPADPRTRPQRIFWRWEYRQVASTKGFHKISGARLSMFKNIIRPTDCKGELYESVMTLYPLQHEHDNALFRCYLVVDFKPVGKELFGTYTTGSVGDPPPEKALKTVYKYTTTSLVAAIVGCGGFFGSLVVSTVYFFNKRLKFCTSTAIPKELIEEEEELDKIEHEINKELDIITTNPAGGAGGTSAMEESSMGESSEIESSEAESSMVESSVAESSVAESSMVESSVVAK